MIGIASCEKDSRTLLQTEIEQLEQAVKENAAQDNIEKLLTSDQSYIYEFKSDSKSCP